MDLIEILKWVGIVLAAGFVGYFGRYLAMMIIERIHKKKAEGTSVAPPPSPATVQPEIGKEKAKAEKKKAKAEAKRAKKEKT